MTNKPREFIVEPYTEEDIFGTLEEEQDTNVTIEDIRNMVEDYGEWKELIGYMKGKNLNPKLVKKYLEAVLEINKVVK